MRRITEQASIMPAAIAVEYRKRPRDLTAEPAAPISAADGTLPDAPGLAALSGPSPARMWEEIGFR
jgi:hypothetical protein